MVPAVTDVPSGRKSNPTIRTSWPSEKSSTPSLFGFWKSENSTDLTSPATGRGSWRRTKNSADARKNDLSGRRRFLSSMRFPSRLWQSADGNPLEATKKRLAVEGFSSRLPSGVPEQVRGWRAFHRRFFDFRTNFRLPTSVLRLIIVSHGRSRVDLLVRDRGRGYRQSRGP